MKKTTLLFIGLSFASMGFSQVGINTETPHTSTALDIRSTAKGMLLPRMTTNQKVAIVSPATGLLVYDTTLRCISQNAGTPSGASWVCLSQKDTRLDSFYMPSIAIDASVVLTAQSLDLYAEYKKQFNTPTVVSAGAPAAIPYFPVATDLYYYVTSFDNTVLKINSLSASGVLNYDIVEKSGYASFMNVVFVIK
ncbi:hypothetical protein CLV62_14321 [Dysgonomonas alginatilytica]|uniref:Uncharacterized protein n=1 Tax=Dysgonomonas alginatilytica TaxID=1605892 RepID=A0A2V3PK18_9BACT|nr:hypothetical protein [Dysgonomonas alginatilytica]PXV58841.1 hypothetical protein CLV62_14321 [Dysgonomonas alginatilytica]